MNRTAIAAVVLAAAFIAALAFAGPLNPPAGAITSTGKTTQEVFDRAALAEPRTPISAATTPGDANSLYKITQPGSYYLTGNVAIPGGEVGILITAERVTIDLSGYSIVGDSSSISGIQVTAGASSITVRNGFVSSCPFGGVVLTSGSGHAVHGVRVRGCSAAGISVGVRSKVSACAVLESGVGFSLGNASVAEDSESFGNTRGFGIGSTCVLRACVANGCSGGGFDDGGVGGGGVANTYADCVASFNGGPGFQAADRSTLTRCEATGNTGAGFAVGSDATLKHCTATNNTTFGFNLGQDSILDDSVAINSGSDGITGNTGLRVRRCEVTGSIAHGIRLFGTRNLIEACSVTRCERGIALAGGGNKIARNTCSGNFTSNWTVAAGNYGFVVVAPTSAAINGNSGGVPSGVTDPDANYSY